MHDNEKKRVYNTIDDFKVKLCAVFVKIAKTYRPRVSHMMRYGFTQFGEISREKTFASFYNSSDRTVSVWYCVSTYAIEIENTRNAIAHAKKALIL